MYENIKTIIYFSASGNCRKIANFFSEKINDAVIIDITDYNIRNTPFKINGNIIFIFPVYNGSIPRICAEYINNLDGKNYSAYLICVYGGVYKGKALQNVAKLLQQNSFKVSKGAYIPAPHTYFGINKNPIEKKRINSIFNNLFKSENHKNIRMTKTAKGWNKQSLLKKITGKCIVNKKCIGCNKCINVCPVKAIDTDYKSNKNCILCGSCVNECPIKARRIKFYTPIPYLFIKTLCKKRKDEFFIFYR